MATENEKTTIHHNENTGGIKQNSNDPLPGEELTDDTQDENLDFKINPKVFPARIDSATRERAVQRMQIQHGNAYTNKMLAVQREPSYTAGSLPSPSYVNGTPSSNLSGGGNASAGDSYFVTGGQKGQLIENIKKIRSAYQAVDAAAKKLQKDSEGGPFGIGSDDQMLATAKNLQGTADGILKIADAIDSWTGSANKESIEKGSKLVEYVDDLIHAAEIITNIKNLNLTTNKLADKPNQADVEAWADNIGNVFGDASGLLNLIPKDALPGFIVDYYQGLFSAPKNYINAFKSIMHARYANLDLEAGVASGSQLVEEPGRIYDSTVWRGELSPVYQAAYFQPKAADGSTLQQFMKKHQKDLGADLYTVKKEYGKALLLGSITGDAPDDVKTSWANFIQNS
jgi:hypothetical protein